MRNTHYLGCEFVGREGRSPALDPAIVEFKLGVQREVAVEPTYKERCIPTIDGPSYAKCMSVSGSPNNTHVEVECGPK